MNKLDLKNHFAELDRVAKHFDWVPSIAFRRQLARFANSVGPSNVDDLFALAYYSASECFQTYASDVNQFEKAILRKLDNERQKWKRIAARTVSEIVQDPATQTTDNPAYIAELQDNQQRIWQAVRQLPEDDQRLLEYHFTHGFSFKQIAEMGVVSPGALRVRLVRVLKQLRELLDQP